MPVLPLSADDIRHATDVMPGRDVLERARAADRVFSSLTAASAVTVAVCSGWVVDGGSWYGATLVAVTGIALGLRARHFTGPASNAAGCSAPAPSASGWPRTRFPTAVRPPCTC